MPPTRGKGRQHQPRVKRKHHHTRRRGGNLCPEGGGDAAATPALGRGGDDGAHEQWRLQGSPSQDRGEEVGAQVLEDVSKDAQPMKRVEVKRQRMDRAVTGE